MTTNATEEDVAASTGNKDGENEPSVSILKTGEFTPVIDDADKSVQFEDVLVEGEEPLSTTFATISDGRMEDATVNRPSACIAAPVPAPARPTLEKAPTTHIDLSTGVRTRRTQSIRAIYGAENKQAKSRWSKVQSMFTLSTPNESSDPQGSSSSRISPTDPAASSMDRHSQFRIRSVTKDENFVYNSITQIHSTNSTIVIDYLRWTFKAHFWEVILVTFVCFMVLTLFFALLLYLYGHYRPQCISTATGDFREAGTDFVDAYHLSWTTLSTVGYGLISPRVSTVEPIQRCLGVNVLMAVESFVGVLFGGVTGAIIFGKIARVQSIAQVLFSHPIVVRYGSGVVKETTGDDDDNDEVDIETDPNTEMILDLEKKTEWPCPILEFRLINELSNSKGGEIMDAKINVVASTIAEIDEADLKASVRTSDDSHRIGSLIVGKDSIVGKAAKSTTVGARNVAKSTTKGAKIMAKSTTKGAKTAAKSTGAALLGASKGAKNLTGSVLQRINAQLSRDPNVMSTNTIEENGSSAEPQKKPFSSQVELEKELERELEKAFAEHLKEQLEQARKLQPGALSMLEATRTSVAVDEGSKLVPRRIFHKLQIETDSHPFFKRVWTIRHRLDASSPLLSRQARRMITHNDGNWPDELNGHRQVREHLHFNELIVSFSGTANVSGSAVYAQKVYDYADLNVGYTFANVLAMSKSKMLVVDRRLLNDVKEQQGGGGEPFRNVSLDERHPAVVATQMATGAAHRAVLATKDAAVDVTGVVVQTGEKALTATKDFAGDVRTAVVQTGDTLVRTRTNALVSQYSNSDSGGGEVISVGPLDSSHPNHDSVDIESGKMAAVKKED